MTAVLLGYFQPDSPEWHEARRNRIGASEIAAIVGLSPFESAYSLWLKKKGILTDDTDKPVFYWGHALEPLVAKKFAENHPEFWVMETGTFVHSERPWQLANLDRGLFPPRDVGVETEPLSLLEIKTSRYGDGFGKHGTDEVPLHVRCQVMQQMDVFGMTYGWVAVLIGGSDYREYRIDYDADDARTLRDAGQKFWESLQTEVEPPVDASFATYDAVRARHPEIDPDGDVQIPAELADAYLATKAAAEAAADQHRQIKSKCLSAMGDARRALIGDRPVLRRQPSRNGVALYTVKESA